MIIQEALDKLNLELSNHGDTTSFDKFCSGLFYLIQGIQSESNEVDRLLEPNELYLNLLYKKDPRFSFVMDRLESLDVRLAVRAQSPDELMATWPVAKSYQPSKPYEDNLVRDLGRSPLLLIEMINADLQKLPLGRVHARIIRHLRGFNGKWRLAGRATLDDDPKFSEFRKMLAAEGIDIFLQPSNIKPRSSP